MRSGFDISEDELPIFLAETEEHLQILEEDLVKWEQSVDDAGLLNSLFRAAHTLKGIAGVIGHKRLVDLTHALETAFDGVRKNSIPISTPLIDLCLEAVDALRLLRDEVVQQDAAAISVDALVKQFSIQIEAAMREQAVDNLIHVRTGGGLLPPPVLQDAPAARSEKRKAGAVSRGKPRVDIVADISPGSAASAARAFQLMLALQSLGEIIHMDPSQEELECAAPVAQFKARLATRQPADKIRQELERIAEIDRLVIQGQEFSLAAGPPRTAANAEAPLTHQPPRLGDFLVSKGHISKETLQEALKKQRSYPPGKAPVLGQILVASGWLSQEKLDEAVNELVQLQRAAIQSIQSHEIDPAKVHRPEKTVRTSVERLDNLMNLVGELITDRNRLLQIRSQFENSFRGSELVAALSETAAHIGRITDQLQEEVMQIRMLPVANVFNKYPRMVRDLAQKTGKEIELIIQGQDTELDRSVIEVINDPLIHLIRNAVDHGIETPAERRAAHKPARGKITLAARHEQGHIVLTISDDGRGINTQKLRASAVQKGLISEAEAAGLSEEKAVDLLFLSGVSSSEKVTDLSGRGVGMDIVRSNIERLNGSIQVETAPGKGTRFQITLPLTLAIIPTLLVQAGGITFAIPLMVVVETQRLTPSDIQAINQRPVILLRGQILPLLHLNQIFNLPPNGHLSDYSFIVVVHAGKLQMGLVVDALVGEEEVVVKSLGDLIGDIPGISSAAILGDGQVALIVDVQELFALAGV